MTVAVRPRRAAALPAFLLLSCAFPTGGCERNAGSRSEAAAGGAAGAGTAHPRVRTTAGVLAGTPISLEAGVGEGLRGGSRAPAVAFLGIPYAEPPVGKRRWRPPAPARRWEGVREATGLAPACPQPPFAADFDRRVARRLGGDPEAVPEPGPRSEDCLYLNVWTPAADPEGGHPVLVWVHGGAGTVGSIRQPMYDGRRLAARGAVVVTVAYRLGPLGFLAHPALSRESDRGESGNYALLDLLEALRWVRREIRGFGGDPERVTLAGQSAGAALVAHLSASPAARGLFRRAILHSGTGIDIAVPLRAEAREGPGTARAPGGGAAGAEDAGAETGEELGRRLARALGIEDGPDAAAALRAIPPDRLIEAALGAGAMPDRPVVDGRVVPEPLGRALTGGRTLELPVLLGSTSLEAAVLVPPPASLADYREGVRRRYGPDAARLLAVYPASDSASAARAERTRTTDEWFGAPVRLAARRLAAAGRPVWLYRFDEAYPAPRGEEVGSFHGVDIPYLFGTFPPAWGVPSADDLALSERVAGTWLRFAATGDPNGGGLPPWPAYDPERPRALFLRAEPRAAPLPRPAALDLFEARLLERLPFLRR